MKVSDEDLRKEINELYWWHDIELRPGIKTPGHARNEVCLPFYGIPADLTGKSVLDIGAWDGAFSFECERRGASRVLAVDSPMWSDEGPGNKGAFLLAVRELNSFVTDKKLDVYDLSPTQVGQSDLVLFLGVLYHLKHPLLGLEHAFSCVAPGGHMIVDTITSLNELNYPVATFLPGAEVNNDPTNWWSPNAAAVRAMLLTAGFDRVEDGPQLYAGPRSVYHAFRES